MNPIAPFYTLAYADSELIFVTHSGRPALFYWGPKLDLLMHSFEQLAAEQHSEPPALPPMPSNVSLCPLLGDGFFGHPGLQLHRHGLAWDAAPKLVMVEKDDDTLRFASRCDQHDLELHHYIKVCAAGVISFSTEVINLANDPLFINHCAAATLSVPEDFNHLMTFHGRWGREFQTYRHQHRHGTFTLENRTGRTSHDQSPFMIVHESGCNENQGKAYGFHLGWSGNYQLRKEALAIGQNVVQLGELLMPGEVILERGETYRSPAMYASFSQTGLNGLSQQYHRYVREELKKRVPISSKPVHFNTWEALYFDHSVPRLLDLVERAAAVGVERFVLDDGWFKGRNNDLSGLGDWEPDPIKYPNGLGPLIDRVEALGMEFGLWVEPEMVSPDSDLYRAHPDWALQPSFTEPTLARNQLVLDMSRREVQEAAFQSLQRLLTQYRIAYLKWDMNRVIHQPSDTCGRAKVSLYVKAVYALLERLRKAFPTVVIESCSSGGGRADFGILHHTDRIWPSDSNDAIDRLGIQNGFSYLFPSAVMGSHVGPKKCHLTGRELPMELLAGVAMLGHMGIECDLSTLEETDLGVLKSAVKVYKDWRWLTMQGDFFILTVEDYESACQFVSPDQSQSLVSYALLDSPARILARRLHLVGLSELKRYVLRLVWPQDAALQAQCALLSRTALSGKSLMSRGFDLPQLLPCSIVMFSITAIDDVH